MYIQQRLTISVLFCALFITLHQSFLQAHIALQNVALDCVHHIPSIITKNEWEELQLDWLLKCLDKTHTSMGRWALQETLHPTANSDEIKKRQAWVKELTTNDALYYKIKHCLQVIKKSESFVIEKMKHVDEVTGIETTYHIQGGLLSYWDTSQYRESDKLFAKIANLYYSSYVVPNKDALNTNQFALEASMAMELSRTSLNIVCFAGMQGFIDYFTLWMFNESNNARFEPFHAFKEGLMQPFRDINPIPSHRSAAYNPTEQEKKKPKTCPECEQPTGPRQGTFLEAFFHGTWGDRYQAILKNFNSRSQVAFGFIGRGLRKLPYLNKKFDDNGDLILENHVNEPEKMGWPRWTWHQTGAIAGATLYSYWKFQGLYEMVRHTCRYWMVLVKSTRQLQMHLVQIARGMEAIKQLHILMNTNDILKNSCIADHMNQSLDKPVRKLDRLLRVLGSSTFTSKTNGFVYSRGRTLLAHKLLEHSKTELVSVLRAVGELDAVYAMATNMREHKDTDKPFTFVEFIDSQEASITFKNSWIPVLNDAVANDLVFGNGNPTKLVITGPNGGGKSTVLKGLGHSLVLAQSWGIVPASSAQMTLFDALRTCLHPHENLQEGLSTFMAEKGRVDEIISFIQQNRNPGFKIMVLLDEPFKGTVDKESAERIYDFGKQIAHLPESIVCIATHVKKPIFLAEDTDGAFSNRHVVISQRKNGSYKREFRLAEGPARWWFEDKQRRSDFIDWLGRETLEMKKQGVTTG